MNDLDSNDLIQVRSGYFVFITRNLNDIDSQENKSKGNSMNMGQQNTWYIWANWSKELIGWHYKQQHKYQSL